MTRDPTFERNAFLVLLAILGLAFLFLLKPIMIALSLAIILALLLYPTYEFFGRLYRGRRYIAAFTATFLVFLVFILPLTLMITLLVNQAIDVFSGVDIQESMAAFVSGSLYQEYIEPFLVSLEETFNIDINLAQIITQAGRETVRYIYSYSPQVLGRTASVVFSFFVMHFSLYFLFLEGPRLTRVVLDLSPLKEMYENRLVIEFKNMIFATVYGYLFTAFIQAILAGAGFWIAGIKPFLVFATLTFFMSLVPILGATSVWLPITIWLMMTGHVKGGIFLAIYGFIVISGIDNIIKPWIMQGRANIHILLILFSLLGGIQVFGPIGILFGPVITAMFLACVRIYREDFLPTYRDNEEENM